MTKRQVGRMTSAGTPSPDMTHPREHKRQAAGAAVLQDNVTAAITRAVFREIARTGYAALTMEAAARRAGVGKAALYRRWPSKLPMVAGLLSKVGVLLAEIPDAGSLHGDVRAFLTQTMRLLRRPLVRRILQDFFCRD